MMNLGIRRKNGRGWRVRALCLALLLAGLPGCGKSEYQQGYDVGVMEIRSAIEGQPLTAEEIAAEGVDPTATNPFHDTRPKKWLQGYEEGKKAEIERQSRR